MPSLLSPLRYPSVYALLSGALLVLAFPMPHFSLLAWVALAPLLIVLVQKRARWRLFLYGFLAGAVFFGGTCYWIYDGIGLHGPPSLDPSHPSIRPVIEPGGGGRHRDSFSC